MKALSLHQPWASLIAIGAKRIETRSWSTKHRGPLAIHAAARKPPMSFDAGGFVVGRYDGYVLVPPGRDDDVTGLELGAIVATCELVDVVASGPAAIGHDNGGRGTRIQVGEYVRPGEIRREFRGLLISTQEAAFGNFTPGRFAWLLDKVAALDEPIPVKGRQNLWEWRVETCPRCGEWASDYGHGIQGCKHCGWMQHPMSVDIAALDAGDDDG